MKIVDPMSNLEDYVTGKVLAEIRELNDLVKQFTAIHDWSKVKVRRSQ